MSDKIFSLEQAQEIGGKCFVRGVLFGICLSAISCIVGCLVFLALR